MASVKLEAFWETEARKCTVRVWSVLRLPVNWDSPSLSVKTKPLLEGLQTLSCVAVPSTQNVLLMFVLLLSRAVKICTPGRKEEVPMTPRRTPARFGL